MMLLQIKREALIRCALKWMHAIGAKAMLVRKIPGLARLWTATGLCVGLGQMEVRGRGRRLRGHNFQILDGQFEGFASPLGEKGDRSGVEQIGVTTSDLC